MSSKDAAAGAGDEAGVTRWDRPRWISVFSSHNPTIREVTECLGLGLSASSSTTNRGIPKFDNPDYRKLSSEVTKLSKELPKERDALLDFAADPQSLDAALEELLGTYGPAIWGRSADRSCLLAPDPAKKTYHRDLFYEEPDDKEILKIHLHRWIIIKACYYIRNMKLKRPSAGAGADDPDPDGYVSPPKLLSPNPSPPADGAVNGKKRKSSAYTSLSDGDEHESVPAKRPYQSHTMPVSRPSPRKSLFSVASGSPHSTENIPPVPSQHHHHGNHFSPPIAPPPGTHDSPRPLLSPLSSNDLNGAARPATSAPTATGFTAVNSGSFTAVNTAASGREPPQEPSQEPSREAVRDPSRDPPRESVAPRPLEARSYSSPYDSSPYGQSTSLNGSSSHSAPPVPTTSATNQGFQAVNSPVVPNGVSNKEAPVVHNSYATHAASQPPAHPSSQPSAPSQHQLQYISHPQSQSQPQPQPQNQAQNQAQAQAPVQTQTHVQAQAQAPASAPIQSQSHIQPHPLSRSNTPHAQNHARSNINHQTQSRSNTPIAPAQNIQPAPGQNVQPGSVSNMQPASAPHAPPAISVKYQVVPKSHHPTNHAGAAPQPPHSVQQSSILKSQPAEAHNPSIKTESLPDLRILQFEILGLLIQYLFPKPSSPPDERALFCRLEHLATHGESIFRPQMGLYYDLNLRILDEWLRERRKMTQLHQTFTTSPGASSPEMVGRLLIMNELRSMRMKWKNMSHIEGVSPEEVLCKTFAIMTNTEGTEHLFKDGLDKLADNMFEFLKTEDMKIFLHKR